MRSFQPVLLALISYSLYATQALVIEQKLSRFSPSALLLIIYVASFPLAFLSLGIGKTQGPVIWPEARTFWIIGVAAVVFFLADYFMISAYNAAFKAGNEALFAIVAAAALYPVVASALKYVWTRQAPNKYHLAAY